MIFNCQRVRDAWGLYHIHRIEAPDEATARVMMFNRSNSRDWLDLNKTLCWSTEDWIAT